MSAKLKVEKNQDALRKLSLVGENKVCMDCTMKSTPYVVMDFGIFVCTPCAGVQYVYTQTTTRSVFLFD